MDENLKRNPGTVKPGSRKRVVLPQVTVPASELWLFENKAALASVYKGLEESKNGQVTACDSFAKYVKDEI
jgi:hypothetical protein